MSRASEVSVTTRAIVEFLDAGNRAEQIVAAAASTSHHAARLAVERLEHVASEFRQPHAWRVIACAHQLHETGWPPGMWLDDRIDAIADAAELDRGVLQAWTMSCPICSDGVAVWARRIVDAIQARRRLYTLASELEELLGDIEISAVLDELRRAA